MDEVDKHEVFESAWVMVLPSLKEGWGLVVAEAGSTGPRPSPTGQPVGRASRSPTDGQVSWSTTSRS